MLTFLFMTLALDDAKVATQAIGRTGGGVLVVRSPRLTPILLTALTKTHFTMRTLLTITFSLAVLPLMAQVIIDQGNFPRPAGFVDAAVQAQVSGVVAPSEGIGQTWDYSGLQTDEPFEVNWIDASGDTDYPTALNYRQANLSFQGFGMRGRLYEAVDEGGWYDQGRIILDTVHSITAISGGADDVLHFPGQVQEFEGRLDYVAFPASFGSSWESSRIEYTHFNLTVAGFGLNNVPGMQKRIISQDRNVVGEGTLILPDADGNPSGPLDAILIKVDNRVTVDSFFLGGALAPPTLLGAFGLTQGNVATFEDFYVLYVPGFHSLAMSIDVDDDGDVIYVSYRPDVAGLATSIADAPAAESLRAFPNPVEAGGTLHFGLHGDGNTLVELTDMTGRTVLSTSVTGSGTVGSVDLPASVTSGIYTLVTRHAATGEMRTQKVSIR